MCTVNYNVLIYVIDYFAIYTEITNSYEALFGIPRCKESAVGVLYPPLSPLPLPLLRVLLSGDNM